MKSKFHHVALFGKYLTAASWNAASSSAQSSREVLDDVGQFLSRQGCEVYLEQETANSTGLTQYASASLEEIGRQCDLALVVGGDGTMLGVGRRLAPYRVPLIGINQGRLGFITDIPFEHYQQTLSPMLQGVYEEDPRSLMQGKVMRDGHCVFEALALNDVVVNRGATAGMVELRVEVNGHFVSNQRADGLII